MEQKNNSKNKKQRRVYDLQNYADGNNRYKVQWWWMYSEKLDGWRVWWDTESQQLYTKSNLPLNTPAEWNDGMPTASDVGGVGAVVLDGELYMGKNKLREMQALLAASRGGKYSPEQAKKWVTDIKFCAFDLMPRQAFYEGIQSGSNDFDSGGAPWRERYARLQALAKQFVTKRHERVDFKGRRDHHYLRNFLGYSGHYQPVNHALFVIRHKHVGRRDDDQATVRARVHKLTDDFVRSGGEGLVVRDPDAMYGLGGRRTSKVLKSKPVQIVRAEVARVDYHSDGRMRALEVHPPQGSAYPKHMIHHHSLNSKNHDARDTEKTIQPGDFVTYKYNPYDARQQGAIVNAVLLEGGLSS